MARRKVTMLEAFEASAREARQRERSEQRRQSADRRGVVGSLLSPFRGGGDPSPAEEEASAGAAAGPKGPSLGVGAVPIDRRPPGGSSWEPPLVLPDQGTSEEAVDVAAEVGSPEPAVESTALPTVEAEAPAFEGPPGSARVGAFSAPMSGWSFAAMVSLVLAAVFAIGMGLGGGPEEPSEVQAVTASLPVTLSMRPAAAMGEAGSRPPEGALPGVASAVGQAAAEADETDLSPAESEFLDKSTTVTVLAITFDDRRENDDPAFDAFELLSAKGLPALRPYYAKNRIFVFVGGAGSVGDLDDVLRKVKAASDPLYSWANFRNAQVVNTAEYR